MYIPSTAQNVIYTNTGYCIGQSEDNNCEMYAMTNDAEVQIMVVCGQQQHSPVLLQRGKTTLDGASSTLGV